MTVLFALTNPAPFMFKFSALHSVKFFKCTALVITIPWIEKSLMRCNNHECIVVVFVLASISGVIRLHKAEPGNK